MDMALAQATKSHETTYTLDDAMDILLTKLDDAIHDMEAGRVQTIGEAWREIELINLHKISPANLSILPSCLFFFSPL